mmetsp:Transcript_66921/g.139488  ORF Transcript_66921/g.139488 Transcript_66921/m.139488 type:complete len:135 (-) Transcript_66921:257-661(-)
MHARILFGSNPVELRLKLPVRPKEPFELLKEPVFTKSSRHFVIGSEVPRLAVGELGELNPEGVGAFDSLSFGDCIELDGLTESSNAPTVVFTKWDLAFPVGNDEGFDFVIGAESKIAFFVWPTCTSLAKSSSLR